MVEESSDDSDDGSYIPSEEEELERDEDEGQDTDATAEESNDSEGEAEAAEEVEEGHAYQNMEEMEVQKRQYARDLTDLLLRFQGCTAEEHAQEDEESGDSHTTTPAELLTLFEKMDIACPDRLAKAGNPPTAQENLHRVLTPEQRTALFCGTVLEDDPTPSEGDSDDDASFTTANQTQPTAAVPHVRLRSDDPCLGPKITWDVDSIIAISRSMAICQGKLRVNDVQTDVSRLQTSLHLDKFTVHYWEKDTTPVRTGGIRLRPFVRRQARVSLQEVPQWLVGRFGDNDSFQMYILFTRLWRKGQKTTRMRDCDFRMWYDEVWSPALREIMSDQPNFTSALPKSSRHAAANATAKSAETSRAGGLAATRKQFFHVSVPGDRLEEFTEEIKRLVRAGGVRFRRFRGLRFLVDAKGLKAETRATTWNGMVANLHREWTDKVNPRFYGWRCYFDIGKETMPPPHSGQTLLWRRCCLKKWTQRLKSLVPKALGRVTPYQFLQLHDIGSVTVETAPTSLHRLFGLLYAQVYNPFKVHFTAGNTYTFMDQSLDSNAVPSSLRNLLKVAGGGRGADAESLLKLYLHSVQRMNEALQGDMSQPYAIREEFRLEWVLFQEINDEIQNRDLGDSDIDPPVEYLPPEDDEADEPFFTPAVDTPYYTQTTAQMIAWVRWNVNKFCYGFEMLHTWPKHLIHPEHARVMLIYLRCLRCFYGIGNSGDFYRLHLDRRTKTVNGVEQVKHGLAFEKSLEQHGYTWFPPDRILFGTMTIHPDYSRTLGFNLDVRKEGFQRRWPAVNAARNDSQALEWAAEKLDAYRNTQKCVDELLAYLRDLCFSTFRRNVFSEIQGDIKPHCRDDAAAGRHPLTHATLKDILIAPPAYMQRANTTCRNVYDLAEWLWTDSSKFKRDNWGTSKPFRRLFAEASNAIEVRLGLETRTQWRSEFLETFVKLHWVMPYPTSNSLFSRSETQAKLPRFWSTRHAAVIQYYKVQRIPSPYPPSDAASYPLIGWDSMQVMPGDIRLEQQHINRDLNVFARELAEMAAGNREIHEITHAIPHLDMAPFQAASDRTKLHPSMQFIKRRYGSFKGAGPNLERESDDEIAHAMKQFAEAIRYMKNRLTTIHGTMVSVQLKLEPNIRSAQPRTVAASKVIARRARKTGRIPRPDTQVNEDDEAAFVALAQRKHDLDRHDEEVERFHRRELQFLERWLPKIVRARQDTYYHQSSRSIPTPLIQRPPPTPRPPPTLRPTPPRFEPSKRKFKAWPALSDEEPHSPSKKSRLSSPRPRQDGRGSVSQTSNALVDSIEEPLAPPTPTNNINIGGFFKRFSTPSGRASHTHQSLDP
jgi:hypothetical protein